MRYLPLVAALASVLSFSLQTTAIAASSHTILKRATKATASEAQGQVYLNETFAGVTDGALPANWRTSNLAAGTSAKVMGNNLIIDGKANAYGMTGVMLPASLENLSNYRIDVEFTIDDAANDSRWVSVMYRASPAGTKNLFEPYYQFAMRQNATASAGTEFAYRTAASGWDVRGTAPFTEKISSSKRYKATVIVYGDRMHQYLNGELLHEASLVKDGAHLANGGVGVQTAGTVMRVYSVKVTEQLVALPAPELPITVQDTGTSASMAPTLVQSMNTLATAKGDGSSNSYFVLDSALNLSSPSGQKLGTLQEFFTQQDRVTVPVMRVSDAATLDALVTFERNIAKLNDVTLLSDDIALLKSARTKIPLVRTAVDFSALSLQEGTETTLKIAGDTNRAGAKIAVLPSNLVTRQTVSHLQRLLITVWSPSNATTAEEAANILTTGVNGVLATDSTVFAEVLQKLPANTLLRKPLVTGHRGMPAGNANAENTLDSARKAVAAGADAVENDIYKTVDGHLVIMHDSNVLRTTGVNREIETMTLAEVSALRTTIGNQPVPTLREFFKEFKNKPITHFIEIKSGTPEVIDLLKKEMAEEGVADQSIAISFNGAQLSRATNLTPELTLGFLTSPSEGADVNTSVKNVLAATQKNNSTFNPSYGGINRATLEALKHRGTTYWPWTINNANDFYKFYSWGTHGLTTDYATLASGFPVAIAPVEAGPIRVKLNEPVSLQVQLTTQLGQSMTTAANEMVLIDGLAQASGPGNGAITFTTPGIAVVMPGYRHSMGDGTYSYSIVSKPVTLLVGDGSGMVTGSPDSALRGTVSCSDTVPGQTSSCTVEAKPGYQVVDVSTGSTCPPGSWNDDRTVYTTGAIATACEVKFDFAAAPVQASLSAVGKNGFMLASVTGGGTGLWGFDATRPVSVTPAVSPPEGMSFPFGVVSLQLHGGEEGQSATVELTYPEALPTDAKYYKFGKTADNASDHWYEYPNATISGNKVVLSLVDGQTGDDDLSANGVIRDPGGVAVKGATGSASLQPVPTLDHAALMLLSGGLGLLAWRRKRLAQRSA